MKEHRRWSKRGLVKHEAPQWFLNDLMWRGSQEKEGDWRRGVPLQGFQTFCQQLFTIWCSQMIDCGSSSDGIHLLFLEVADWKDASISFSCSLYVWDTPVMYISAWSVHMVHAQMRLMYFLPIYHKKYPVIDKRKVGRRTYPSCPAGVWGFLQVCVHHWVLILDPTLCATQDDLGISGAGISE